MFRMFRAIAAFYEAEAARKACYDAVAYSHEQAAKRTLEGQQTDPAMRIEFALKYLETVHPSLPHKEMQIESIYAKLVGVGYTGGQKV